MIETRNSTLALRKAGPDEAHLVRTLAELDDAPTLEGDVLLALVDGEPVAALSLSDGRSVADPFVRSAEALAVLRLRASHLLSRPKTRRRWVRVLRPRLA